MQNLHKKDYVLSSHSTESHVQESSMSGSLSLKMGDVQEHFHNAKRPSFQFQDQDSSSTQSTGQSYPEVASTGDNSLYRLSLISPASGADETHEKLVGRHAKLASSMGTQEYGFLPSQAHIPLHYAEPFFGGVVTAACQPQAMIHQPHMLAMLPARVPLRLELTEDETVYVNPKQYGAILRRRQYRAKLEAQNKLIKVRKPYLHESRHLHALKRARGNGGRFLNTKKLQESKLIPTSRGLDMSRYTRLHLSANMPDQLGNYRDAASTTTCSDVISGSNGVGTLQQPDFRFSGFSFHVAGAVPGGGGNFHHLSGCCL